MPKISWTTWEHDYIHLLRTILASGEERADRTGTGTLAIFGGSIRVNLAEGFPALTTKKLAWKAMVSELLWFIEGSGDERRLAEILHGTRDADKKTIWSPNAEGTSGSKYTPKYEGDLGRVYGVQWRSWHGLSFTEYNDYVKHDEKNFTFFGAKTKLTVIDQLAEVIHKLKNNPTDRRIILSAWNPGELDQMALPPCHMFAQFYMSNDRRLSCQMYQRSVDSFLGLPFNIASYALLTHMIAHVVDATPNELVLVLGDTHIYKDHIEQVKTQISRTPYEPPRLFIKRPVQNIDDFKMDDFELANYDHYAPITANMSK